MMILEHFALFVPEEVGATPNRFCVKKGNKAIQTRIPLEPQLIHKALDK